MDSCVLFWGGQELNIQTAHHGPPIISFSSSVVLMKVASRLAKPRNCSYHLVLRAFRQQKTRIGLPKMLDTLGGQFTSEQVCSLHEGGDEERHVLLPDGTPLQDVWFTEVLAP